MPLEADLPIVMTCEGNVTTSNSFASLIEGLRYGEQVAAQRLFRHFTGQLIVLARRHLDQALASKVDPEELVQSVYKSFLRRFRAEQCAFDTWDSLWGYLSLLTVRKCADRADYHRAARRDLARERALADLDQDVLHRPLSREPTPFEAAVLAETVESLMSVLDERDRDILSLHLQGYTIGEVSNALGRAQRTVRRALARIKRRVRRQLEAEHSDEAWR